MTDGPKHTPAVYQPAWKRCFLPESPWPRLASVLIPGPIPVARGMEQTDRSCLIMFPPIEPGGLCPSGGERDSPESWEGGPPMALVHLSFPSVGAYLLLFYHWTLSFRAQVKFYLFREEGTDHLSERKFYLYFFNTPSCLFPSEPVCSTSLPPPPDLSFPTFSSTSSSFL